MNRLIRILGVILLAVPVPIWAGFHWGIIDGTRATVDDLHNQIEELTAEATTVPVITKTFTVSPTISPTWTISETFSVTDTFSVTPTFSDSPTASPTSTDTPTVTQSSTDSPTSTFSDSPTPSDTLTATSTYTASPTASDTSSASPTATGTKTATQSSTVSDSPTLTDSPTASDTLTVSSTATGTRTETDSPTATDTLTNSPTATATQTSAGSPTTSPTASATPTSGPITVQGGITYSPGGVSAVNNINVLLFNNKGSGNQSLVTNGASLSITSAVSPDGLLVSYNAVGTTYTAGPGVPHVGDPYMFYNYGGCNIFDPSALVLNASTNVGPITFGSTNKVFGVAGTMQYTGSISASGLILNASIYSDPGYTQSINNDQGYKGDNGNRYDIQDITNICSSRTVYVLAWANNSTISNQNPSLDCYSVVCAGDPYFEGSFTTSAVANQNITFDDSLVYSAPVSATTQTLWQNGVQTSAWWGQTNSLVVGPASNCSSTASTATASVTDNITGDTSVLQFNATGNGAGLAFSIPSIVNGSNYYSSGHIQFDIELGSGYSASNSTINVQYGPNNDVCNSANLSGLSTSSFTHESIPFSGGFLLCNSTSAFQLAGFNVAYSGSGCGTLSGIQFYVNDIQITPN